MRLRHPCRVPLLGGLVLASLLLAGILGSSAFSPPSAAAQQGPLTLWPQLAGIKVGPTDPPVSPGTTARLSGALGEGVATQVVLTNSSGGTLADLVPQLSTLTGPNGATLSSDALQLYRVGYVDVSTPSDPAGHPGPQPDALYPIGPDRYYHEQRNGAPFSLAAGQNQPVWIDARIPATATPGVYTGTFAVVQHGATIAQLPFELTVWNFALPATAKLPTTYRLNTWGAYCTHYYPAGGCQWNDQQIVGLTDLYIAEAAAHRITLDAEVYPLAYSYDDTTGQLTVQNWPNWDHALQQAGITSYPLPAPRFDWNNPGHSWTAAETREAIALWRAAAQHYAANGWLDHAFLYTYDEPGYARGGYTADQQKQLVAQQSNALFQADQRLRALVTSAYDSFLAGQGHIGIWVPVVEHLEDSPGFHAVYDPLRSAGKKVWWYDSNDSRQPDPSGQSGNWPDEFIDHAGVNQLVHGPLAYKYGLDGYLYYGVVEGYGNGDVWQRNFYLGANGDGTLFYPGRPDKIGGTTQIPVPSIRLQLLRESWTMYDELAMLRERGQGATADSIVSALVTDTHTWSHDAAAYERARDQLAAALQGAASGAPAVSMTAPADAATVSGTITLSASASDASGVAGVQFLVDGTPTGVEVTSPPFQMAFDTSTLANGSHAFAARARDTAGATTTSAPATVTVSDAARTPGKISLVTGFALAPASPITGQTSTASFTVQNTGGQPISVQYFLAGARDPSNANVDFPASPPVTLQPGQQYTYQQARRFTTAGPYTAWPAYYDGTNWIELAPTHTRFTVQAPSPGKLSLVTPVALAPATPVVGQTVTASFTVQNTGGQPISVQYFLAGARDPSNANVDFPASPPVTLGPSQSYTYSQARTFGTAGTYSIWPAYYDGTDWIELAPTHTSFAVHAPSPGKLSLVTPVALAPATPVVGQAVTASFTVQNTGGQPISVQYFLVGARDPSNANVDFPASSPVTLQPGQQYTYQQARTFASAGSYAAWPAYYDGTNWVELAPHASFSVQPGAAACSPTLPQFGSGTFPSACWRPYADASPFNTPLSSQLAPSQLAPNSAAIIQHVLNTAAIKQPSNLVANVDGTSGWPTYYSHFSQNTDPAYRVHCTAPWGVCPLEGTVVHIPQGAVVQGGRAAAPPSFTPDAHLTVVDVDSGWEYDFWQVQRSPIRSSDGAQLNISWGGRTRIDGDGLAAEGTATAAHFGNLAGRIRAEELLAGSINHALFIVIDCDNGQAVYPAQASDKRCSNDIANAPPMGSRLQLDMSRAEIDALPVPEWKKVLLRAMATYGMFFGDTGSSFTFSFQAEAGVQYTASGRPDQWLAVAKKYGWAYHDGSDPSYPFANYTGSMRNDDDGIDWTQRVWTRLRVVAPCVSDGSCR